ncbi:MAG: hypothetical protein IKY67_06645 [Paludibacteraceae bacterium]|nr:hypothetical protein [Paludibacteraceae bacterium]
MFNINIAPYKTVSRQITGAIHYVNNNVEHEISPDGQLVKYTIERTAPKGKFFGIIISQLIRVEVAGIVSNIQKGDKIIPTIGIKDGEEAKLPNFYVTDVVYDKVNKITRIEGKDILEKGKDFVINDVGLTYPIMLQDLAQSLVSKFGATLIYEGLNYEIAGSPNFSGKETLKGVLSSVAECAAAVCYVSEGDKVKFRKLNAVSADTLTPADYYELTTGDTTILTRIASATELGDNVSFGEEGYTQASWNNPFFDMLEGQALVSLLETIGNEVIGLTGSDYSIKWRGCPAYEIGDYITLQEKDGSIKKIYYFDEVLEYNGGLISTSSWEAGDGENIHTNPSSLGAILNQTTAKVDKVNKQIELVVSTTNENKQAISALEINNNSISASVKQVEKETDEAISSINDSINNLTSEVSAKIGPEDIQIAVQKELDNGTSKVITTTGFTFDSEGLTVSKSGSEITTTITEDGMTVYKGGEEVLVADNEGVKAEDLHATTYLIVGRNSRFEDLGYDRTACFWIGN